MPSKPPLGRPRRRSPRAFERLEDRRLPATFWVTSPADSGPGTLRQAILDANASPNAISANHNTIADLILFDTGGAPLFLIQPLTPLPTITEAVDIQGYSAQGASTNDTIDERDEQGDVAVLVVQLDGTLAGTGADGLVITSANSVISGLMITGFDGAAIHFSGVHAVGNTAWGNFIGVVNASDPSLNGWPVAAASNPYANGVGVRISGSNNRLGGTTPPGRNLIQGNRAEGVILEGPAGTGNLVEGNFILDNGGDGVLIQSPNNFVGEAIGKGPSGGGNVISGNLRGVHVVGPDSVQGSDGRGNIVVNNEIGTSVRLPNVSGNLVLRGLVPRANRAEGIAIESSPGNVVGGLIETARNVIAANDGHGILITGEASTNNRVLNNWIGFNVSESVVSILPNRDGVRIASAGNTVGGLTASARNVISTNAANGITLDGPTATRNLIQGNYIGTILGGDDFGNTFAGIELLDAPNNSIGGSAAGAGNVISGNNWGVAIRGAAASGNLVAGNRIGTTADGQADLGNAVDGVLVEGSPRNTIGGTSSGAGNLISGNNRGIRLEGEGASRNLIQGNRIGTDETGELPLGNAIDGVIVSGGASSNTIGGTAQGAGNAILFNIGSGVRIDSGVGNTIRSNAIDANQGLGIVLNPAGSANRLQPAPVLTAAVVGSETASIQGSLRAAPLTRYTIEIFASPEADPTGQGEGRTSLGAFLVTTDESGLAAIVAAPPGGILAGQSISATATSPDGDTSEFSNAVPAGQAVFAFATPSLEVSESAGVASLGVVRSGELAALVSVSYRGDSGLAGTLTFLPGEAMKAILVPIPDDETPGGDRTWTITLSDPTNAAILGEPAVATLTIRDDDVSLVQFSSATYTVIEGGRSARVTVTRSGSIGPASVGFATSLLGSARPSIDFTPVSGTLDFADGQTSRFFDVPVRANGEMDGDRTVVLDLSDPSGVELGSPSRATLTILDDDLPGQVQFGASSISVNESDRVVAIPVGRSGGSAGAVAVSYRTIRGNAAPGEDYGEVSGVLIFGPGVTAATITIPIVDDAVVEGTEEFTLVLDSPTGGASIGLPASITVTIRDDDRDLTGPIVTDVRPVIAGGSFRGLALTFNEPLDPARAVDLANYDRVLVAAGRDGRFGTADDRSIPLVMAAYDEALRQVTLTPSAPLGANVLYRVSLNHLLTPGNGSGVSDRAGNLLDGDGDGLPGGRFVADVGTGTRLSYRNLDGDRVTLRLARGGRMDLWVADSGEARLITLADTVAGRSQLGGSVIRARTGNGKTLRPALAGASGVRIALKAPPFVGRL